MASQPNDAQLMGLYFWAPTAPEPGRNPTVVDKAIDMIAVQGLGASPYYTWVKKVPKAVGSTEVKEVMWLRDLLPNHVENARIATFSYLSDWYTYSKGVKTSLRELGEQLLNALRTDREKHNASRRPLIFIGHSMGGLVIKQALVLAGNRPNCEDIKKSTVGIVFLGTPHGGTDIAGYGAFIAMVRNNDPTLIESLRPSDKALYDMSRDFAAGCKNIPMLCFYEKVANQYARELPNFVARFARLEVVSQRSATREGEDMMYLLANHSELNKFGGEDDPNFREVCKAVESMARNAPRVIRQLNQGRGLPKATTNIPFPRDKDFVGRERIIDEISRTLFEAEFSPRVALVGLGGIGKSQIAIEFAYRLIEQLPKVHAFWVHANSFSRFEQSYQLIADVMKIPGAVEPQADVLGLVCRWLESDDSGEWFIILDNADEIEIFYPGQNAQLSEASDSAQPITALSTYLPQSSKGCILITSRDRNAAYRLVGREDCIISVYQMEQGDAQALLQKKLPKDLSEENDWGELVANLEYLPLAITQAAAYIVVKAPWMSVSRYLELFRSSEINQTSLLSRDGGDLRRDPAVPNSVVATWQISFTQIQRQNLAAADLLSLMCIFDQQGIPESLLRQEDGNPLEFEDSIGTLIAFSFVTVQTDKKTFQMHPLVQLSTRKWLEMQQQLQNRKESALSLLAKKYPWGKYENWELCEPLEPHVRTILEYDYSAPEFRLDRATILNKNGWYALRRGNYHSAREMIQESCDIRQKLLPPDHLETIRSQEALARVFQGLRKDKEAKQLMVEVVEARKRVQGPEHSDRLYSMSILASSYSNLGQQREAQELLVHVLEIQKHLLGLEHGETLFTMGTLASSYYQGGQLEASEELLTTQLKVDKMLYGPEHPETLTTMLNLATIYMRRGRLSEAEQLLVQVLETRKEIIGQEHPNTLNTRTHLAEVYGDQGRLEEEEELLVPLVEARKRILGLEHPETVVTMVNLAANHRERGRLSEAEQLLVQVLEIQKKISGQEHPEKLNTRAHLAGVYSSQGRLKEEEELLVPLVEARKRVLGHEHPRTMVSMHNLAVNWKTQGRDEMAIDLMDEVVRRGTQVWGSEHANTVNSARRLREWQTEAQGRPSASRGKRASSPPGHASIQPSSSGGAPSAAGAHASSSHGESSHRKSQDRRTPSRSSFFQKFLARR